ncbi:MAG: hypothetical protein LBO79_04525 [Zoogloeaceae bacterium]|nr:hypothetical protein [Zoogloeaceae bacterium]
MKKPYPAALCVATLFLFACNPGVQDEFPAKTQDVISDEICEANAPHSALPDFLNNIGMGMVAGDFGKYPEDVKCFVKYAAGCEYFADEEVSRKEISREIIANLNKYCLEAKVRAETLKKKYARDAEISKLLGICDTGSAVCVDFQEIESGAPINESMDGLTGDS